MTKKMMLFLFGFVFLFSFKVAFASVSINEIMYDLDGGDIDWVEVYNNGNDPVPLSSLKLFINDDGSNHSINNFSGSSTISPGSYGVIVANTMIDLYTAKWGSAGNIFTSSFTLLNSSGKIEINSGDKLSPMSSVSYNSSSGASGDANSLQLIGNSWVPASPTPGKENASSASSSNTSVTNTTNPTTNTQTTNTQALKKEEEKILESPKIKTKIIVNSFGFVGTPVLFKAETIGYKNESLYVGKYLWNFGDGGSMEKRVIQNDTYEHTYFYPGEYDVVLDYYSNSEIEKPGATFTYTVKIVSNNVTISSVGSEQDFFIEISNNSSYDVDISKWYLSANNKFFIFPKSSVLGENKNIMLSPKITGFNFSDKNDLRLYDNRGQVVYDYSLINKPKNVYKNSLVSKSNVQNSNQYIPFEAKEENFPKQEDLSANVSSSEVGNGLWLLALALIIGVSCAFVFFVRKKEDISELENKEEFDILDE